MFSPPSSSRPFLAPASCTLSGSLCIDSMLQRSQATMCWGRSADCGLLVACPPSRSTHIAIPLDTRQDCCNIVRGRPPVLQNIQAQLACAIYVRVEHLADKLHARWLVRVGFFEMHDEAEGAIFERCVSRAYNYCVPACLSGSYSLVA